VTLGESTTFGITLTPGHRPWPELLEGLIRERLHPPRPVQVINAGVMSYNLPNNVHRLVRDILPLQPDLIISYHGFNGFSMLSPALPQSGAPAPPSYQLRPLQLLADAEFGLKMRRYRWRYHRPTTSPEPMAASKLMDSAYAGAYRQLIQFADTNRIRLALADYSMAVNPASDPEVIEFYRMTFPFIYPDMQANVDHTTIVRNLTTEHPKVIFVDTHPGLDGNHRVYLDLMHFDPDGDRLLAENMFAGLRKLLEQNLLKP
jgi:lysophospholipase L1-like esterase